MKQGQFKSILLLVFSLIIMSFLIGAVTTTLISPEDNAVDDDGFLDLRGSCTPASQNEHDGTTSWNITNATLYSNVNGIWQSNATLNVTTPLVNITYFFNFTNHINQTAEGEFVWDIQCFEQNYSNGGQNMRSSFEGNRTIRVDYAKPTAVTTSPDDNSYSLNGHEIPVVCTGDPSSGWNITSVSLMTTIDGTWLANATRNQINPGVGAQIVENFTINGFGNESIPDGTDLIFGCSFSQRKTIGELGVSSERSSANRTLNVEYPPTTTLIGPADGNWSKNLRVNLSYTTLTKHDTGTSFTTRIWTNETGEWLPATGTIIAQNNTQVSKDYIFDEKTSIIWGVQSIQQNDGNVHNFSVNRTINLDSITPTITGDSITIETSTVTIKFTPTDVNLDTAIIFTSLTENEWKLNYTNGSANSGEEIVVDFRDSLDGIYNYSITVNDSAGNIVTTGNVSFTVDLTAPNTTVTGNTSTFSCTSRNILFETNESANYTFYIDTDTEVTDGEIFTGSEFEVNHSVEFDFGENTEVLHYFNITTCDVAGNCNTTGQMTFLTPASVCGGWSQYAIYHNEQSLLEIQNQSGADLVYFWNGTDQNWIFKTAGLSTNDNVIMGRDTDYHVAHLFENTNSTWFRNISNQGHYNFNLSEGNNFIALPGFYNFGNLTESFMNTSRQFPSFINQSSSDFNGGSAGIDFGPFNVSYFAGYNNTLQDYVNHVFNFTWANATFLQPCLDRTENPTCMETAWLASGFNMTWNGTQIYTNWTKA